MNNQLVVKLNENNLTDDHKKQVLEAFGAPFEEAGEILKDYTDKDGNFVLTDKSIKVTSEDDFAAMADAREKRLILMRVRTGVENKRKELGDDYYKTYKAINGIATFIKDPIKPVEDYLAEQEKFAEIKAAERAAVLKAERIEKLLHLTDDIALYNYEAMTDDQFTALIASLQAQKHAELAAAFKAEEDRKAIEEAERKRQADIEAENAKLKAEAEKRDKEIAAERVKLQAEADAKLAAERAVADEERRKREAIEAEQRIKAEAEAKAKQEAEVANRNALLAPDKEKLLSLATQIEEMVLPALASKDAQAVLTNVEELLAKVTTYIRGNVKGL